MTETASTEQILDCSKPANFLFWFVAGALVVLIPQAAWVQLNGGNWAYLLRVGEDATLRPKIDRELGPVQPTDRLGHDGQMCYAIARDPFDQRQTSELIRHVDPQYRYRRILYPLLAGAVGTAPPAGAMAGLVICLAIGSASLAVAVADLCYEFKLPGPLALVALLNPGVLTSAVALTPDVLATGLAIAGLALWVRGRHTAAIALLAAAVLTKETHVLVAAGIAISAWRVGERREAICVLTGAILPFILWSSWVWWNVVHGTSPMHNFTIPGLGFLQAVEHWLTTSESASELVSDFLLGTFCLVELLLLAGLTVFSPNRVVNYCSLLWAAVGLTTSISVWGEPTNLLRVMAPVWPLMLLNLGEVLRLRRGNPTAE